MSTVAAWRIGLLVLVGVNLTLLCAGHDDGTGTHRSAPHVALLGEPDEAAHDIPHRAEPGSTGPTLLTADLLETLGPALADVLLVVGLFGTGPHFHRVAVHRAAPRNGPQTSLRPQRRPPRPAGALA